MFQKALQQGNPYAVWDISNHAKPQSKERAHRLRFLIGAKPDQSLADVTQIIKAFGKNHRLIANQAVDVEPLFPSSESYPNHSGPMPIRQPQVFRATVYSWSGKPADIAEALKATGNFIRVVPDVPFETNMTLPHNPKSDRPYRPRGWELMRRIGSPLRH